MKDFHKREVAFERVVFFSDAIVAIAITLLALELKLEVPEGHTLSFADLAIPWKSYVAFLLSFINIAGFWRTHHQIYSYIHKMDTVSMAYNFCWLFFIVTLPFSTNVLSNHFGNAVAIFLYSSNIFALSILQNFIWDSAEAKKDFINENVVTEAERSRLRVMFNLDMINGLLCIALSFFYPTLAFFLLFFKIPVFILVNIYVAQEKRKAAKGIKNGGLE